MFKARVAFVLIIFCSNLSCESGVKLRGTITIPPDVQALFSESDRGRVMVYAGTKTGHMYLIETRAVLCSPTSESLIIPIITGALGCMEEGTVEVIVDRLPASDNLPCGLVDGLAGGMLRENALAYASQTIFEGKDGGGRCKSGDDTFELTAQKVPSP